jgi:hypothetical protein
LAALRKVLLQGSVHKNGKHVDIEGYFITHDPYLCKIAMEESLGYILVVVCGLILNGFHSSHFNFKAYM